MDSDVKLQDGTVEVSGDKFKTSVTNVEMYYYGGHLLANSGNLELGSSDSGTFKGFKQQKDGTIEISGNKLKTSTTNVEMYYYGGHLLTNGGTVELGSTDSGTFKGFKQQRDGTINLTGDKIGANVGYNSGNMVEINGHTLKTSVSNLEMYYSGGHLLTKDGNLQIGSSDSRNMVEINACTLKTSVSDLEMYYSGGHLLANGGTVELGSTDSGTFKGFKQQKDGTTLITGDSVKAEAQVIEIGSHDTNGLFKGFNLTANGCYCYSNAFTVLTPNGPSDSQQRIAVRQSSNDELVLNENGHYQGGIKLDGLVKASDVTIQSSLTMNTGSTLLLQTPDKSVTDPRTGRTIRLPGIPIDVLQTIEDLTKQITDLQNKIAALESKIEVPQ